MRQLHLFFLGSRMDARSQEFWPRHENKSRERCGSRASSPYLRFFHDRMTRHRRAFFLRCRAGYFGSSGPCCQLWHGASEPCQTPHVHLPK